MEIIKQEDLRLQINRWDSVHSPSHIHKVIEVLYLVSGEITAYCDGIKYNLKPKNFFVVMPNQIHGYDWIDSGVDYYCCIIDLEYLGLNTFQLFKFLPRNPIVTPDDNTLIRLLEMALEEYEKGLNTDIIFSILTAFLGRLFRYYEIDKVASSNNKTYEIISYCNEHFRENITVEQISQDLQISRFYLSHIFNNKLHTSFKDYLNTLRINETINLIKTEKLSITDAALTSGFATIRTFNRVFKKIHGVSPREYISSK